MCTDMDFSMSLVEWVALAIVLLVAALEASAFVRLVFRGESAVLLGGVLAYPHRVATWLPTSLVCV